MKDAALREHVLYLLDGGACTSPINRRAERNNPIPQTRVRDRVVGWKLSLQRRFNREVAQTAWGSWNLRSLKMLVEVIVAAAIVNRSEPCQCLLASSVIALTEFAGFV